MKNLKFPAGTYIEIDDMAGGRRVAMMCKDGVSFWDSLNTEIVTPLTVHASMNPVGLGSLIQYAKNNGLTDALKGLLDSLRVASDSRINDPLFVMRALWYVAQNSTGSGYVADNTVLQTACEKAALQGLAAERIHELAAQYCAG